MNRLFVYIVSSASLNFTIEIEKYEVSKFKKRKKNTKSNFTYSSFSLESRKYLEIFLHSFPLLFINIKNQYGESVRNLKFGIWTVVEAWLISMNDYALFPRKHANVGPGFWKRPTWEREWGFLRRWYVTYEAREIPWACWLTNVGKEDGGVDRFVVARALYTAISGKPRVRECNLRPRRRKVTTLT